MQKIIVYYNKIEEYFLVGSLMVTVFLVTLQILFRYVLNSSLSWSEELTRYIFIWQIWLGASYGLKKEKHLKVNLLYNYCSPLGKKTIRILANLIFLSFCLFLTVNGSQLVLNLIEKNTLSPAMAIPLYTVYASLPLSSFIMMMRLFAQTALLWKKPVSGFSQEGGGD